ncbi:hypothetical protein WJX77_000703 [Trebouxia sp. C0004]
MDNNLKFVIAQRAVVSSWWDVPRKNLLLQHTRLAGALVLEAHLMLSKDSWTRSMCDCSPAGSEPKHFSDTLSVSGCWLIYSLQ